MIPENARELTQQQLAVLCLIAKGFKLDAIAERLGVQPLTAEFHLLSLKQKLGISSTKALIQFAKTSQLC
ncbi:MAG TPA: helix-turn-helix transcriptional regulator [Bryobacteraceae bacterium]|jgi:DNA-binding NarL/FixJ family response regulator|nr:helix-turn-helix transcriptional regulator [Bryobacteraceae bacterium]